MKPWPATGPKVLWKAPAAGGFSSFSVAGGKAFTLVLREVEGASQETLLALDANTGKELWIAPLGFVKWDGGGDSGTNENKGGDGPRSTPTSDGARVYSLSSSLVLAGLRRRHREKSPGRTTSSPSTRAAISGGRTPPHRCSKAACSYVAGGGPRRIAPRHRREGRQGRVESVRRKDDARHARRRDDPRSAPGHFLPPDPASSPSSRRPARNSGATAFNFNTSTAASPVVVGRHRLLLRRLRRRRGRGEDHEKRRHLHRDGDLSLARQQAAREPLEHARGEGRPSLRHVPVQGIRQRPGQVRRHRDRHGEVGTGRLWSRPRHPRGRPGPRALRQRRARAHRRATPPPTRNSPAPMCSMANAGPRPSSPMAASSPAAPRKPSAST